MSDVVLDIVPWNGCESTAIYGCTDPSALNYNADATVDDGSCQYDGAESIQILQQCVELRIQLS